MPLHLEKLLKARKYLPPAIRELIDESVHASDEVHQFIRITSSFEYLIKLISASLHGAVRDGHPGSWYGRLLNEHFIEKSPTLGDWSGSADKIRKRVSGHPLLSDVVDEVWKQRPAVNGDGKRSEAWNMCRVVGASRTFITEVPKSKTFNYTNVFSLVVNLRNAFAHGALTVRFARRFGQPVTDALAEVASVLKLSEKWDFFIPLRFDPSERSKAVVLDCHALGSDAGCEVRRLDFGDRYLKWGSLYLNPKGIESLESAILLEPLLRYEQSHRDFQFFNRYDENDLTAEYLSYRTGDFDFDPGFENWADGIGAVDAEEEVEVEADRQDESTEKTKEEPKIEDTLARDNGPEKDQAFLSRIASIIQDGVQEKTLRRCRERLHRDLDEFETEQQLAILGEAKALLAKDGATNTHRVLGNVARDFGFYQLATEELKAAAEVDKGDKFIRQSLGHALLQLGSEEKQNGRRDEDNSRFERGKQLIREAKSELAASLTNDTETESNRRFDVRSLSMLVDVHCRLGEFDEALERCNQGLEIEPENYRLLDQKDFLQGQGSN